MAQAHVVTSPFPAPPEIEEPAVERHVRSAGGRSAPRRRRHRLADRTAACGRDLQRGGRLRPRHPRGLREPARHRGAGPHRHRPGGRHAVPPRRAGSRAVPPAVPPSGHARRGRGHRPVRPGRHQRGRRLSVRPAGAARGHRSPRLGRHGRVPGLGVHRWDGGGHHPGRTLDEHPLAARGMGTGRPGAAVPRRLGHRPPQRPRPRARRRHDVGLRVVAGLRSPQPPALGSAHRRGHAADRHPAVSAQARCRSTPAARSPTSGRPPTGVPSS